MSDEKLRKLYLDVAKARHQQMNHEIAELAKTDSGLEVLEKGEIAEYDCTGDINVSAVLVRTSVSITDMIFSSENECLDFNGSGWGIGLGATGASIGSGTFNVSPDYLRSRDKIKMQVFFLTAGIGGVEVTFWNSSASTYYGIFVAGNLGLGAGSSGGDGKFKNC